MSDKPLIIDEPVVTGWLRSEYHGDQDKAKGYALQARKVLGGMRSMYGVNDRIANGEGGGFYKQAVHLPDGTRIEALTNDGHDTIRIYASSSSASSGEQFTPEFPSTAFEGTPTSYAFTPEFSIETPEQQIEIPEILPQPYMWIGARIRWEDYPGLIGVGPHAAMPFDGLTVMVIEPGGDGSVSNGIVMSNYQVGWASGCAGVADAETAVLYAIPITLDDLQTDFSNTFPRAPAGMHNFSFNDGTPTAGYNGFQFTRNGLRLYDVTACWGEDDTFQPYDPDLKPEDEPDGRVFTNDPYAYGGMQRRKWDQVVVLDPFEEEAIAPSDERDATNWSRRLLERTGMASGLDCVLPGEYIVKIAAWGDPRPESSRRDQTSPNLPGFHYDSSADFREYLTENDMPLRVEVEVRLFKEPFTTIDTFTIEVPDYDDQLRTAYPFGDAGGGCPFLSGDNPHAANWWQGALLIDVAAGTIGREENYAPNCFVPSTYSFDALYRTRYPVDIYVTTINGWSGYGSMEACIANNLFIFLDKMCTAYYGYGYEIHLRMLAEIQAAAPTSGSGHFLYDITTNTFAYLGSSGTTAGNPPNWFLPYRLESRAKCRGAFWIDAQSGLAGTGIYGLVGDPDLGNTCCEDVFFGGT